MEEATAKKIEIVLVHPEIPQNTGNIGRLCVAVGSRLHLVRPLGFSLDDKYLKRAGLDYWKHLDFSVHENWDAFLNRFPGADMHFFTTRKGKLLGDTAFKKHDFLVFGSESSGFPESFYTDYAGKLRTIPMPGKYARSLNLSNAVSIALYTALAPLFHEKSIF